MKNMRSIVYQQKEKREREIEIGVIGRPFNPDVKNRFLMLYQLAYVL